MTLFASGDSITSAELSSCCTRALRLDPSVHDILPRFMLLIDKVRERAEEFDVLHFHIDLFHFPLFRSLEARTLTTLHGRQDLGDLKPLYYRFGEMPLVSVSSDQRKPLPHANFVATRSITAFRLTCVDRRLSGETTSHSWDEFRRKSAPIVRLE